MVLILYNAAVYLGEHLLHARTTRQSMIEHYLDLTTARGQEAVTKWEMEPTEAKFVDGEWQSVYRLKVEPCKFCLTFIEQFFNYPTSAKSDCYIPVS